MLASEILTKARALIEKPENWTQEAYARDENGDRVAYHDPSACKFCAEGAVYRAKQGVYRSGILKLLDNAAIDLGRSFAVGVNDNTDHPTVLRMFDLAIEKAKAAEAPHSARGSAEP